MKVLKHGMSEADTLDADAKVRTTVESVIVAVRDRGDAAIRELSETFDHWTPTRFRLEPDEIRALMASLSDQVISDLQFAQA